MIALALLVIGGCTTVRDNYILPDCTIPPFPTLPIIEANALAGVDDDTYWALERRERRLTDWALEMEAILEEVCADENDGF